MKKALPRHLGKQTIGAAFQEWEKKEGWKKGGTGLNFEMWMTHIYVPECQDDEMGVYLPRRRLGLADKIVNSDGVEYLSPADRADYVIAIDGGKVTDARDDTYDTSEESTVFSGKGWAIFVAGTRRDSLCQQSRRGQISSLQFPCRRSDQVRRRY